MISFNYCYTEYSRIVKISGQGTGGYPPVPCPGIKQLIGILSCDNDKGPDNTCKRKDHIVADWQYNCGTR